MVGFELTHWLTGLGAAGVVVLMLILFSECGLLVGFFLPGDTILITAGLLAVRGVFGIGAPWLVALFFAAAVAGEMVGYWFGQALGQRLFQREDSLFFHKANLVRAEDFYQRYGPLTIFFARFIPVVRTFAPLVAGIARMDWRKFMLFNLLGGAVWTSGMVSLGYFAGSFLHARGIEVDQFAGPIIIFAVLVTVGSPLVHALLHKQSRRKLLQKLHRS